MAQHLASCCSLLCSLLLLIYFTEPLNCNITVYPVPTSVKYKVGNNATLECRFNTTAKDIEVTWKRIQCDCKNSKAVNMTHEEQPGGRIQLKHDKNSATIIIQKVDINDSGVYMCSVSAGKVHSKSSCGTYLQIMKPAPEAFLKLEESTKNKIITAEGILLLICAVVPGTFLLFRKRAENEKMQELKKHLDEGENLYEGLNLDECSMYEDISRGLQSTYQDVANLKLTDMDLERP
ncbi:B-cell antigen receptor complex-associated protein alpha chain [Microcaecilia unicolor]|uniref:B-cell antigen receptor complex-associated protein alpha chain n=1 Tax=Microcaecilia unicolor TaxID=1415580 RepID=A0A6P7YMY3_9AMPH|nr:B-cell antigen receptor complex-associated protein alpha chain [Microcaecilia unicolor]